MVVFPFVGFVFFVENNFTTKVAPPSQSGCTPEITITLEALDRGVPIVTTDIGAEGIPGANELMKLSDEPEVMAQHIVSLYGDYKEMARMSQAGRVLVQKHFSSDAVLKIIAEDFLF